VPRTTDLTRIRGLLDRDRAWAAYAIGDLSPEFAPYCSWHVPSDDAAALLLVYRGFDLPIAFTLGPPAHLAPLFQEIEAPRLSLQVRPEVIDALSATYRPTHTRTVWRMVVEPSEFQPAGGYDVVRLDQSDLAAVSALYDEGGRHGEGPKFFDPRMLQQRSFRGVKDGMDLVAIAGTHSFSPELGVCAIGNVYTRRDRRRQGLAACVTSAVVQHALSNDISTIVLNVAQVNAGARRVYERLGFHCHCEFVEGEAEQTLRPVGLKTHRSV
jgi:GNAT superfamily N-acetyltransferase